MNPGSTEDLPIATVEEGPATFHICVPSSDDHIGKFLLQNQVFYEAELLHALRRVVKPGDTIIDVGANIGNHTVFFAGVLHCKVLAVEPVPLIAEILRSNVSRNQLSDLVSVYQMALGHEDSLAEIAQFDDKNYGGTSLRVGVDGDIEVKRLDALVTSTIGLIKIDAEGMDYQVLLGAREVIERDMPVVVIEAMTADAVANIESFLSPLGYSIVGEYNATPTYVFFPTRSSQQLRRAVGFLGLSLTEQGVTQRSLEATIRQVSRYAERLSAETYTRVLAKLEEQDAAPVPRPRQASSDSVTSAALKLCLDSVTSTLETERKAFIELSEQYKAVTNRALRLEGDVNARNRRMKDWQALEVAAESRERERADTEFRAVTGRSLRDAVRIVQELQAENTRLSASLQTIEAEKADIEEEVRKLMVSRGEYGRQNRNLKLQLAEMTLEVEGLQADCTKLQSKASAPPSLRVPGVHRIRVGLRKIKTKIATPGK